MTAIGGRTLRSPADRLSLRVDTRAALVCAVLLVAVVGVGLVSLSTGNREIPVGDVVRALTGHADRLDQFAVITLRLPRYLTAVLVGAALGIGGAVFQSLSRNPLGSPDVIGFNHGAAAGAVFVILVLDGGMVPVAVGSIVGGLGTALVVYALAYQRGVHGYRLVLVGIGVGALLASVNSYLLLRANIVDAERAAVWLTGSLNGRGWSHLVPLAVAVAALLPLVLALGSRLRLLEMGDETASGLGVSVERSRLALLVVAVGLTGAATAAARPVSFVALAAPQLARRLTRSAGTPLVPAACVGALLLTASDLAAVRVFAPTQLPVGVVTFTVGGLYLVWLLLRERRAGRL